MNATEFRLCFQQLGAELTEAHASALLDLFARIDGGQLALGPEGLEFDVALQPRLQHLNAALEELDDDALRTVGGVVAMQRSLAAEAREPSLVPASYVPVATGGDTLLLFGVDGARAGHLFSFTTEGQNQAVASHDDVTDLGTLSELLSSTEAAQRPRFIVVAAGELKARLADILRAGDRAVEVRVTGTDPLPELAAGTLQAATGALRVLVINCVDWNFTLELQRSELGWAQLWCTVGAQPGHRKAAFVKPLVQLLRSVPSVRAAEFQVADGLGRAVKNALAQVAAAASWHVDVRGG